MLIFWTIFRFCHAQLCCNSQGYQHQSRHQCMQFPKTNIITLANLLSKVLIVRRECQTINYYHSFLSFGSKQPKICGFKGDTWKFENIHLCVWIFEIQKVKTLSVTLDSCVIGIIRLIDKWQLFEKLWALPVLTQIFIGVTTLLEPLFLLEKLFYMVTWLKVWYLFTGNCM